MAHQEAPRVSVPGEGPFHDPTPAVAGRAAELPAGRLPPPDSFGNTGRDARPLERLPKWLAVIAPRSAVTRWGRLRGRPRGWGMATAASTCGASLSSCGWAEASTQATGVPDFSTRITHLVPLPFLVLPTPRPPF
jgi:hypothetical protein